MFFNASLENACSEQGARMSAMDNSTRNASEMLEKLTLKYNRLDSLALQCVGGLNGLDLKNVDKVAVYGSSLFWL